MPQKLISGFREFKKTHGQTLATLVEKGQDPEYFIISCIDSRSNPGTIFNAEPGVFFGHKAMGAIVRPYKKGTALAAALHFAIEYNNVKEIIVLGHTGCGAIQALINKIDCDEIGGFLDVAQHACEHAKQKVGDDNEQSLQSETERQVTLMSLRNLLTYPSVKNAFDEGRINIRGWIFDMTDGDIFEYNVDANDFISLTAEDQEEKTPAEIANN